MNDLRKAMFETATEQKARLEWEWEGQVVNKLLSFSFLTSYKQELMHMHQQRYGPSRLSLDCFFEMFPNYPLYLVSSSAYKLAEKVNLNRALSGFEKSRVLQIYNEAMDLVPKEWQDIAYGVVLRWPYIKDGLIVHNYTVANDSIGTPSMQFVYTSASGEVVILETFNQFLLRLPDCWHLRGAVDRG